MSKSMLKADHALWIKRIDEMLTLEMGATKAVRWQHDPAKYEFMPTLYEYQLQTQYGLLTITPEVPFKLSKEDRLRYDATVFARFTNGLPITHPYGHKWNFHFGSLTRDEIDGAVTHIAQQISRILPVAEVTK